MNQNRAQRVAQYMYQRPAKMPPRQGQVAPPAPQAAMPAAPAPAAPQMQRAPMRPPVAPQAAPAGPRGLPPGAMVRGQVPPSWFGGAQ